MIKNIFIFPFLFLKGLRLSNKLGKEIQTQIRNKRAMLGNIMGGFLVLLMGFTLISTIMQQLDLATNCNQTLNESMELPIGATDSFGGGGSGNFGGYDGKVKKSWDYKDLSLLKENNESVFGNQCINGEISPAGRTLLKLVPGFFVIAILFMAIALGYSGLRSAGLIGDPL